jgi:hypothetical protein
MGGSGRSQNTDLHQCFLDIDPGDLPFNCWARSTPFPNRRDSEQILARKLNRVLVNDSRLATFPNSEADFTGPGISDHTPRFFYRRVRSLSIYIICGPTTKTFPLWLRKFGVLQWRVLQCSGCAPS